MDGKSPRVCRSTGIPWLMILALAPTAANAADPAPGEVRVARLVRDLGAVDYRQRQTADEELARLGPDGRAALEKALESADLEVRLRAKRLLERLQLEDLWSAGRVTVKAENVTASKILRDAAAQSQNHVHIGDPYGNFAEQSLSVEYTGASYWEVIDDICRRTVNRVRPHYDMHTPGIVISSGSSGQYPRAYAGPVRAQIPSARRMFIEELSYEEQKAELTSSFQFSLQFNWEDRFKMVGYATQPELIEAVTDNQIAVGAAQPAGGGWNASTRGLRQVTASLKLNPVSVTARSLETLKIRWGLIAIGEPAVLEMPEPQAGKRFTQDDLAAQVEALELQSVAKYILTLSVVRDMALPEPHEVLFQEYEVELVDALGRPFRQQSQAHSLTDRGVQLKTTFVGESTTSMPQTVRLHYPRLRAKRDVELVFRQVPLPVSRPE